MRRLFDVIASGFGDVDEVIARLHAEERRDTRFLFERHQVFVRHEPGPDAAARKREPVDGRSQVETVLLLVQPAVGEQAADETVHRALRGAERPDELGERPAGVVDDLFQDARDAFDRAVVLRHALHTHGRRARILRCDRPALLGGRPRLLGSRRSLWRGTRRRGALPLRADGERAFLRVGHGVYSTARPRWVKKLKQ
jgi:hypothetical protein